MVTEGEREWRRVRRRGRGGVARIREYFDGVGEGLGVEGGVEFVSVFLAG